MPNKVCWLISLSVLTLVGCADPLGPGEGWLRAELADPIAQVLVDGPRSASFDAAAEFSGGTFKGPAFPAGREWFSIRAADANTDSASESFGIYALGTTRLAPGEYDLAPLRQDEPNATGVTLLYEWVSTVEGDDRAVLASAESGTLVVTASSEVVVKGTFRAVVAEYCRAGSGWPEALPPCEARPWVVHPNGARMVVEGTFAAVRDTNTFREAKGPLVHP